MKEGKNRRVVRILLVVLGLALPCLWYSCRTTVRTDADGFRTRIHRLFGRVVLVDFDTKGMGRYDIEDQWSFREPLDPNASQLDGPLSMVDYRTYPYLSLRDCDYNGQWDTWIWRQTNGLLVEADTNNDGKADIRRLTDAVSQWRFLEEIEAIRGF